MNTRDFWLCRSDETNAFEVQYTEEQAKEYHEQFGGQVLHVREVDAEREKTVEKLVEALESIAEAWLMDDRRKAASLLTEWEKVK